MDKLHTVELYGYEYTVKITNNKITHIACKDRWPLLPVEYARDDGWLLKQLEIALDLNND